MPHMNELLIESMQDLLHAEHQLLRALPKMAKAAHEPKLKQAFETHLEQTQTHVQRLEQAFEALGAKAKTKVCKGMQGLIEEGQEKIAEGKEKDHFSADITLAGAAQKVEHYEISGYGTLRSIAEKVGENKVAKLLSQTLAEEERTDQLLTEICSPILENAIAESDSEGEDAMESHRTKARSKAAHS